MLLDPFFGVPRKSLLMKLSLAASNVDDCANSIKDYSKPGDARPGLNTKFIRIFTNNNEDLGVK